MCIIPSCASFILYTLSVGRKVSYELVSSPYLSQVHGMEHEIGCLECECMPWRFYDHEVIFHLHTKYIFGRWSCNFNFSKLLTISTYVITLKLLLFLRGYGYPWAEAYCTLTLTFYGNLFDFDRSYVDFICIWLIEIEGVTTWYQSIRFENLGTVGRL
jgi:hypothetical protein